MEKDLQETEIFICANNYQRDLICVEYSSSKTVFDYMTQHSSGFISLEKQKNNICLEHCKYVGHLDTLRHDGDNLESKIRTNISISAVICRHNSNCEYSHS